MFKYAHPSIKDNDSSVLRMEYSAYTRTTPGHEPAHAITRLDSTGGHDTRRFEECIAPRETLYSAAPLWTPRHQNDLSYAADTITPNDHMLSNAVRATRPYRYMHQRCGSKARTEGHLCTLMQLCASSSSYSGQAHTSSARMFTAVRTYPAELRFHALSCWRYFTGAADCTQHDERRTIV